MITALGKIWHPEHFVCGHCNEQLGTQNFFERDEMPFCERDYHMLFSPQCAHCNGPILDVSINNRIYVANFSFFDQTLIYQMITLIYKSGGGGGACDHLKMILGS